ncbi:hypothetical protein [Roseomonas sp. 18066]|uniref:hypothetical protein n=1 Tax=Roseomonas sp. 18066 TaxID=2681412 RepID=UPI0013579FD9|nr:hypothetical protein [Roseomonas sp. 18066]
MLAVLGAVLVDRADPEPVLTVAEGSREAAMPEAAPEAASVAPASSMAQADQADGPDALLEEVGRLLRLADRLDRDIDNFVQASRVPDGIEIAATPSPLPRPEQVVATGAFTPFPGNGPDLAAAAHSVVENNAAVLPPPATIALVPSPLVEVPFIPMDMLAGAVPPPDGPNTNPLPASRHGAPVTAADVRASPPKLAAVSEARPSRAIVATPALAARRCQAIILRVQLGEESSHADQRFLRAGCR